MLVNRGLLTLQIVGMFVVFALALFLAAGTVAWPAGWAFLLLFFGFVVALSLWLLKHNPDLLIERMTGIGKPDQKAWDKLFYALANLLFLAWLVVMPLDAVRFHWSQMASWLQVLGAIVLLSSFYLFFLIFRENAYLSPAVRVQTDRGQKVVSTGPYRYIRHPMYATALMFLVGTTLLLGSWYGLVLVLILAVAIVVRALQEERTLRAELPGYGEYMVKVKYRLIPYVW
ncbi:MAG TPA: isoprenylcysteine carboxylmethyltransferase family protein [Methylomirabilota bacterium]|jgi:protein-S-isoprenylcysteine O-methyltransferase Ste14|nr:isoprenylcysteine carboxylmethyltransferase family protein [Methylomirabilota bacterium]